MKKFRLIVSLFVSLAVLVSCKSAKPTVSDATTSDVTTNSITENETVETLHDTIFKMPEDKSSYKAELGIVDGKVVVKEVTHAESGRNLNSPKVRLDGNTLNVDCEARAQELFAFWKSKQTKEKKFLYITKKYNITRTITITINKLTWFQKFQIKGFWILLSVLGIWLYIKFRS